MYIPRRRDGPEGLTFDVAARPHPQLPVLPIVIATALAIFGFLALNTARNVVRHYELQSRERHLRVELRQLDADHEQLDAIRQYLQSDEYVEDVARRVLGLVRPGETLVVVSGPTPAAASPAGDAAAWRDDPWWKDLFIVPYATPGPAEGQPAR